MKKKLYFAITIAMMSVFFACNSSSALDVNKIEEGMKETNIVVEETEGISVEDNMNTANPQEANEIDNEPVQENISEQVDEQVSIGAPKIIDTNPPEIFGVQDKECILGQAIVYFGGVSAVDDIDGEVPVTVDSEVDMHTVGSYKVVYKAIDSSGNEALAECTFSVVEPESSEQVIHEFASKVIEEIITDDMLDVEKAKAIFDYVHKNMKYGNGTNNNYEDWRKAAYQAFTTHTGDCYNIWAITKALLDETDIEYLDVERVKTARRKTRHYWCMVNLGTGWYVFDPTYTPKHKAYAFMWNEAQCKKFPLYWNYDKTVLPELATERFDYQKEFDRGKAEMNPT